MRFYFPDSQDLVSPTYDFVHDEYSPLRVRQRDDLYAHEVLDTAPYQGVLVSKAIVDGSVNGAGKYSLAQRERLYRDGVRRFFRLPQGMEALGDCGAFNYVNEPRPPFTVDQVLDFYEGCGFDAGISIDHVILGFSPDASEKEVDPDWAARRKISLKYAREFIARVDARRASIEPIGAAQGWSPKSFADSVQKLQSMGYQRIALGGMVALRTRDVLHCLEGISKVLDPSTELHLLGITRVESMETFADYGVTSFDSTAPFKQAFMDDRDNYHTPTETYVAVRVPQVEANAALKRQILAGAVAHDAARKTEREALRRLRGYEDGSVDLESLLAILAEYESLIGVKKSYLPQYRRTLEAKPWRECQCALCIKNGIEIAVFRGTERNKRRGFHNLSVFNAKMSRLRLTQPA